MSNHLLRYVPLRSATALVIANMIGAGIFTSTGFQAAALGHPGFIFLLWIVGGLLALCGALAYAELGASLPKAGGEYVYLREAYGPLLGFMSAFVSLVAGFAAPIASAVKSLVAYLRHFFPALENEIDLLGWVSVQDLIAIAIVWGLIAIHRHSARKGMGFNDIVTLFKVAGVAAIILGAIGLGRGELGNLGIVSETYQQLETISLISAFATSLVFVMFCYSGWNASAYIASEMKDPQRDLPRSLVLGTGIVVLLYLGLNVVYFLGADVDELAGRAEVGLVAAENLFGTFGITLVVTVLTVSILASASAMTIAGPRVLFALGQDVHAVRWLAKTHSRGAPSNALVLQGIVTTLVILSGTIDQIQQYAGFTLTLGASLAVTAVFVLRRTHPDLPRPFRTWGYPWTPLAFLSLSAWMLVWAMRDRLVESLLALGTVFVGGLLFVVVARRRE